MDFIEAVKAMKEGMKMRRAKWHKSTYLYIKLLPNGHLNPIIRWQSGDMAEIQLDKIEAQDWEIYEEDKDWSLKKYGNKEIRFDNRYFVESNVKKMLDLIIEDYKKSISPSAELPVLKEIIEMRSGLYE